MADLEWTHRFHGDYLHDLVIFLAERMIVVRGGKLKSVRDFKKRYICACEPDRYFEFEAKLIKGNKRTNQKQLYVIEVETHATRESVRKKYEQYKETLTGLTDLIVLNLDDVIAINNWKALEDYISERLPI